MDPLTSELTIEPIIKQELGENKPEDVPIQQQAEEVEPRDGDAEAETEGDPVGLPVAEDMEEAIEPDPEPNTEVPTNEPSEDKPCEDNPDEPDEPPSNPWSRVKCVFCSQTLNSSYEPKLLECLHASCSNCIAAKIHDQEQADGDIIENVIECPTCHVICNSQNIIENQFLMECEDQLDAGSGEVNPASSKVQDVKCSSCSDNAPAVSWCVECAEFICQSCVQAHQRLKITKEHTIKAKEEAESEAQSSTTTSSSKNIQCSVHPQEQLSLFCELCDKLTCRDCQLSDHRDHKYKFIHEIAAETRNFITGLLSEVSYKRVLLKSAMKVIDDRQTLIADKKKVVVKEITQMVVRLTNAINARGKHLVLRLNEVCDAKQKTLTEKKEALEQLSLLTDHCIEFVNNALGKGSDMALLYSKKSVTAHLQRIKSRRADIPNPEIPVRISLALEKVPDLIRVVSSIGAIVVDGRVYQSRTDATGSSSSSGSSSGVPAAATSKSPAALTPAAPIKTDVGSPPQVSLGSNGPFLGTQPAPMRARTPTVTPPLSRTRLSPLGAVSHQVSRNLSLLRSNQPGYNHQGFNVQQPPMPISPQHGQPGISISPHGPPPPPPLHPTPQNPHMGPALPLNMQPHHLLGLRHANPSQQVTSSTHPASDPNIRNLLQQNPPLSAIQPIYGPGGQIYRVNVNVNSLKQQSAYQNALNRYHNNPGAAYLQSQSQSFAQQIRNTMRNQQGPPPPYQPPVVPGAGASPQWHIPQQQGSYHPSRPAPASVPMDESFKIHLKTQGGGVVVNNHNHVHGEGRSSSSVTSSVSKTPSPGTSREDPNSRMDKFCQDSVNDLMATIAKLDSNGIEVIPEIHKGSVDSVVDSSTPGFMSQAVQLSQKSTAEHPSKEDSNEDWCAVCMDGGELICCDNCPKVFHVNCHIPSLKVIPGETETWQCLLCTDVANLVVPEAELAKRKRGLAYTERKMAERIVLEIYCQYEASIHFRELRCDLPEYLEKVKKPMALDIVRRKLDPADSEHYGTLSEVVSDVRRIFKNAKLVYARDSQIFQDAKHLDEFLERLLTRWMPSYVLEQQQQQQQQQTEEEEDTNHPRKLRRLEGGTQDD